MKHTCPERYFFVAASLQYGLTVFCYSLYNSPSLTFHVVCLKNGLFDTQLESVCLRQPPQMHVFPLHYNSHGRRYVNAGTHDCAAFIILFYNSADTCNGLQT